MAPQVGLEPTTLRLTAGCSAIELLRSKAIGLIGVWKIQYSSNAVNPLSGLISGAVAQLRGPLKIIRRAIFTGLNPGLPQSFLQGVLPPGVLSATGNQDQPDRQHIKNADV